MAEPPVEDAAVDVGTGVEVSVTPYVEDDGQRGKNTTFQNNTYDSLTHLLCDV